MSRPTIILSKFVGTISLGLLTGTSLVLSTTTIPALLALPSLPPARQAFTLLRHHATAIQSLLSYFAVTTLTYAFLVSPRSARHPYLVWTAGTVVVEALVGGYFSGGVEGWRRGLSTILGSRSTSRFGTARDEEEDEEEEEEHRGRRAGKEGKDGEEMNGEVVRERMEAWQWNQVLKTGIWGVGFGMSVVGIWGDRMRGSVGR